MFAHSVSTSEGPNSVKAIFKNLSEGPSDEDTIVSRLAVAIIGMYPQLLAILPSPMKKWAAMLRTELGRIAQEVWETGKRNEDVGGMDARVVEVLSKYCACCGRYDSNSVELGQQKKAGAKISKDDAVAEVKCHGFGLHFDGLTQPIDHCTSVCGF